MNEQQEKVWWVAHHFLVVAVVYIGIPAALIGSLWLMVRTTR